MCGREYKYCNCVEYSHMEPWHDAYCSANCKDLYNITAGWVNDWLDKDVEIARLEKMDLSYIDKLPEWMQKTIKEMQEYKPEVPVETLIEVLDKDISKDDDTSEIKDEDVKSDQVIEEKKNDQPRKDHYNKKIKSKYR